MLVKVASGRLVISNMTSRQEESVHLQHECESCVGSMGWHTGRHWVMYVVTRCQIIKVSSNLAYIILTRGFDHIIKAFCCMCVNRMLVYLIWFFIWTFQLFAISTTTGMMGVMCSVSSFLVTWMIYGIELCTNRSDSAHYAVQGGRYTRRHYEQCTQKYAHDRVLLYFFVVLS